MKLLANAINGGFHRNMLPSEPEGVDCVLAAIAYGDDATTLLADCLENRYKLDIWMRYDHTVPVSPLLLQKLLESATKNVSCYLVPDVLHAKAIWWKGHGAYIGSANLTDRAWISNIEVGLFVPQIQLEGNGLDDELEDFFSILRAFEEVFPLDQSIVDEQRELQKLRNDRIWSFDEELKRKRAVSEWTGPTSINKKETSQKRLDSFVREWREGMGFLEAIARDAPRYKPSWLNDDVPASWQADQFLHAYYYNEVVDGNRHPFEEYFSKNKSDPGAATKAALQWWSALPSAPSDEDINCHIRAPKILHALTESDLSDLNLMQFTDVCHANHSTVDHARRMTARDLAIPNANAIGTDERVDAFAKMVFSLRNSNGESVIELIRFVLDGGPVAEFPKRLYEATKTSARKLPHFGVNQMAELAGWARPKKLAPRNGRTSKSLRALGYDVKIY